MASPTRPSAIAQPSDECGRPDSRRTRRTSNCLELPVALSDAAGRLRTIVTPDYLEHVVGLANEKFEANAARLDALQATFEAACRAAEEARAAATHTPCVECAVEANERQHSARTAPAPVTTPGQGHWRVVLRLGLEPKDSKGRARGAARTMNAPGGAVG